MVGSPPPAVTERLNSWTSAGTVGGISDWLLAIGADFVTAVILLQAVVSAGGNPKATLYYQTGTTRTDDPGAWAAVPNGLVLSGGTLADCKANISIASLTGGKMWIRFGVFLQPDTGGTRRWPRT